MTRLVAFGCSNTFGQALPDVWDSKNHRHLKKYGSSKCAWPQILADKLNLECVNLGIPGASNKEIWWKILNYQPVETDIVIILWSLYNRHCIIIDQHQPQRRSIFKIGTWINETTSNAFFKYIHHTYDMEIDFYLRCNHINQFLKNKVKLIKHGNQDELLINSSFNEIDFLKANMNVIMGMLPKALDDCHPGIEAHKQFAIEVYNEIKDEHNKLVRI